MESLLSRYADCAFWFGRYIERAENLARLLDVTRALSQDFHHAAAEPFDAWRQVLDLNSDLERFMEQHKEPDAFSVFRFYSLERANPGSILSCITAARFNAQQLRPLLPVEVWNHLNGFYQDVRDRAAKPFSPHQITPFCDDIKAACQAQAGIADATLYRDEAWYFLRIGRMLERADMTARLLDLRAATIDKPVPENERIYETSQWTAILRAAAGLHGYRRLHHGRISRDRVAGFLVFDADHPRSIRFSLNTAHWLLDEMIEDRQLPWEESIADPLYKLCTTLHSSNITEVIDSGLHDFLDDVQSLIIDTTTKLGAAFFAQSADQPSGTAKDAA